MILLPANWHNGPHNLLGGCGVSTSTSQLTTMRVEMLKSREISQVRFVMVGGAVTHPAATTEPCVIVSHHTALQSHEPLS